MPNRIMLDLETLGRQAGCVVATIGAVRFNADEIVDRIYLQLDIRQQQAAGLHLDADTVLWWMARGDAARAELHGAGPFKPKLPLEALRQLRDWMTAPGKVDELWGNGADFDNVILAALYRHLGEEEPWRYAAHRCYRTLARLVPDEKLERCGTHHCALDDAISQAKHLQRLLARLTVTPPATEPVDHRPNEAERLP